MKLKTITSLSLLALAPLAIPPTTANGQEHGWIFDRDHVSGRTFSDAHGDLSGSISGEILLEDQPAALVLNGETTHVSVEEADESMLPERNITVEAWVLLNRGTRWGGIMGYLQDNGDFERGWVLGYDNDDFVFGLSTDDDITYMDSPEDFTPRSLASRGGHLRWRHHAPLCRWGTCRDFRRALRRYRLLRCQLHSRSLC